MALSYQMQSLEARLRKLEKDNRGVDSFPPFSFESFGANQDIQLLEDSELLISGPAGTGKSFACLAKVHNLCLSVPHTRALVVRKTKASMAESVLKTFEVNILGQGHPLTLGPTRQNRKNYVYPNGSRIVIAGMDNPDRVMSSEYDIIYVCEATELHEQDWDNLSSRIRNGTPDTPQQLLADCNPQAESHWLYRRAQKGATKLLKSNHQDNPAFFNHKFQEWTEAGRKYLERLQKLSGVRYKRLYLGQWAAAEGAVYDIFDPQIHSISGRLPQFTKYISGMDFGYSVDGAGVLVTFGVTQDGTLILVDEVYKTGELFDWWVGQAQQVRAKYKPEAFLCDPSRPENIKTLNLNGVPARKGNNKVNFGVDLVLQRLKAGTLRFHMNSLKKADTKLQEELMPHRLTDEILGYMWDDKKESPIAENNHALDAMRYVVAFHDKPMAQGVPATSTSVPMFSGNKKTTLRQIG